MGSTPREYIPDFIVQIEDGHEGPLNLIVAIKGYRGEDAKDSTLRGHQVPGGNNLAKFGRQAFAEFAVVYQMKTQFATMIQNTRPVQVTN